MKLSVVAQRSRARWLVAGGASIPVVLAAMVRLADVGAAVDDPSTLEVTVGAGEGTVAGQAFLPGDVTIERGGAITFVIGSDDPHTITLGEGPPGVPAPFWPAAGFAEVIPGPPPFDLGAAVFDGTGFVNTGVLPGQGSSATIGFPDVGVFPVFCVIHPGMAGIVRVTDGGDATTPDDATVAAQQTVDLLLGAVEPVRQAREASVKTEPGAGGSTVWSAFADAGTATGALPGGGTGYLELNEYFPAALEIEPGDTVTWTADRIHTVTFLPDGVTAEEAFPDMQASLAPVGGSTFDGTEVASSGVFNFAIDPAAGPVTEYSLTFPEPGVYPFFCALHVSLGQVGVVAVGVPLPDGS